MDTPKIKLLIVEDLPSDVELMEREIRKTGIEFESRHVETREDYLAALDEFKPDVILSDFKLPNFDGMTALKLALERAPLIPFIIATGSMNEETAVECMKAGATDYILKEHIRKLAPAFIAALQKKKALEEKARTEHALEESEEKFRKFAELAPVAITIHQGDRWIYANPASREITGYTPEELSGIRFWDIVHPDFRDFVKERGFARLAGETPPERYEFKIVTKGGREAWIDFSAGSIEIAGRPAVIASAIDITDRKAKEESIRTSLEEKEVLLREIHHRVMNNMQIIISLLNLQARNVRDPATLKMIKDSQRRIHSMALVHEGIYQSKDLTRIDFGAYLQALVSHLFRSLQADPTRIRFESDVQDVFMNINTAIPCGLVVNELLGNALKYAFPGGRAGFVRIALRPGNGSKYELVIKDDGVGFPEGLDFRTTGTLGLQVVMMLVDQLDGKIELKGKKGTEFRVTFDELVYKKRV